METTYALNENETLQEIKRPPRIGFIKTFAGTTPPEGTLLCDGSAVSRDTYSELFAAIGTTWGSGDGTTTFNLPDLRDVWILCAGTEHEAGESVAEGLPNITGSIYFRYYNNNHASNYIAEARATNGGVFRREAADTSVNIFEDFLQGITGSGENAYIGTRIGMNASRGSSIYGASTHVTPASVAVLPCIVYE